MHSNMAATSVRFARTVAVAVVVALLGELLLVAAARVSGEDSLRTRTWVRWDAYRYIGIARRGYVESAEDPPASNTGWFPGFPGLIAAATRVAGVKPAVAGRAIALAALVALLATLALILPPTGRASAALAGLLAAGGVFRFSVGRWDAYVRYQQQFGQGLYKASASRG